MDDADRAQGRIESAVEHGIYEARRAKSLPATGACYWCGDDVAPGYLFCCGDCRKDWDKAQHMRRITGK